MLKTYRLLFVQSFLSEFWSTLFWFKWITFNWRVNSFLMILLTSCWVLTNLVMRLSETESDDCFLSRLTVSVMWDLLHPEKVYSQRAGCLQIATFLMCTLHCLCLLLLMVRGDLLSIFLDNVSLFGVTMMKNIFHADNVSKSRLFLCSFVIIICKV